MKFPFPELHLWWKKELIFFPPYRPLFLPHVLSDFEIKEFYLTSESDVTYFIHFQANYVQILLSESDQWVSEKSRLVSEGEDFCLLHCTLCLLWSIKTIASVHYHQSVWRWPRTQTSPSGWEDFRALNPFNLCKCKMYFVRGT